MGSAQSNITKNTLSEYNSFMNSLVVNSFNTANNVCTGDNTFTLTPGAGPTGEVCFFELSDGDITINQTAKSLCNFNNVNSVNTFGNFKNYIVNNTRQFIEQDSKNQQGFFATAFSLQIQDAETVDQVVNLIANNISGDYTDICQNVITSSNTGFLPLCGIYNNVNITVNQDAYPTGTVSCINDVVTKIFEDNSTLNQFWMQTDQKLASEQKGVGALFAPLKWLIIGGVILAVVIVVAVLLFLIFGSKGGGQQPDLAKEEIKASLEKKALKGKEGGIASSSRLGELEKGAESRAAEEGFLETAKRRIGKRFL